MKRKVLLLFFCIFNCSRALSSTGKVDVFEKYHNSTIHFLDGISIKGYGKLIGFAVSPNLRPIARFNEKYKIMFKASKDSKPDIWTDLMVSGITFHYDSGDVTYVYVKLSKQAYSRLLEVVEEGAVNLYIEIDSYWVLASFDPQTGTPTGSSYKEEEIYYYLIKEKDGDSLVLSPANTLSGSLKAIFSKFKKKVKKFFDDCDGIKNKIDSGDFNRTTIPEIVYYYNDFCAEIETE